MARNTQPQLYQSVNIQTTVNGFIVHASVGDLRQGFSAEQYSFESFASMTKWLSKNVVNGGAA